MSGCRTTPPGQTHVVVAIFREVSRILVDPKHGVSEQFMVHGTGHLVPVGDGSHHVGDDTGRLLDSRVRSAFRDDQEAVLGDGELGVVVGIGQVFRVRTDAADTPS